MLVIVRCVYSVRVLWVLSCGQRRELREIRCLAGSAEKSPPIGAETAGARVCLGAAAPDPGGGCAAGATGGVTGGRKAAIKKWLGG